ncbi:MAG: TetR/AcrR family transcriptional regulator, partial [Actinomycetes bacterium]
MSKDPRGNRHAHLNRDAIARAALALVDRDGPEALSLRRVAGDLGVGTMTLYHYVPSREALVADIVALLIAEMDLTVTAGLTWREGAKQVGRSLRAMALRHPRAFALVAAAASDEPPLLDFARRLRDFYVELGAPLEAFVEVWSNPKSHYSPPLTSSGAGYASLLNT